MKIPVSILLGGATLLLAAGCSTVNTVEPAESRARPDLVDSRVTITDDWLADRVRVVQVNQSTVSGNLLKVQAEVQSESDYYRTFNYRFVWIDADGMAVTRPTPVWRSAQLQPRGVAYLSAVAPSPQAVDFKLELIDSGDSRENF